MMQVGLRAKFGQEPIHPRVFEGLPNRTEQHERTVGVRTRGLRRHESVRLRPPSIAHARAVAQRPVHAGAAT